MELGLMVIDSKVVVSSRTVAENYSKRHDNVLRDIRLILEQVPRAQLNYEESSYINEQGRKMPEYMMDRQGFSMLVTGFTGQQARRFTYEYTLAFEKMAAAAEKSKHQIPQTYSEALRLAADMVEKVEVLQPKAEMHDRFLSAENAQSMGVVAKALGIGPNKLFRFLRDQRILLNNNVPYQEFMKRGYFRVVEKTIQMGDREKNIPQTLVTSKGVDYIAKLLKEN